MGQFLPSQQKIIKEYRRLGNSRYRKKSGKVILEGAHLLREALRAGVECETVLFTPTFAVDPSHRALLAQLRETCCLQLSEKEFNDLAQTDSPQGVGVIARIPALMNKSIFEKPDLFFLLLDRIQDPGNLGTIIRCAAAAAVDGVILLPGTADPTNPKALRAAMGGNFYLPVIHAAAIPEWQDILAKRKVCIIAADPGGQIPYYKLKFDAPTALIIGNESKGISSSLLEIAHVRAYIPMVGPIKSLNAAMAATIFIYERLRQCSNNNAK